MTDEYYVEPDPASMYIDEDGILWDGEDVSEIGTEVDDDGDCLANPNDNNRDGIPCNVIWILDADGDEIVEIREDYNVNEDPEESKYLGESSHRTFIIGTGKMAFVMMLGIFIPLFLALGLVRDETENGTLHYLLSKPIHRAEFIIYRLLGYLLLAGTYILVLVLLMALVTSLIGPGDSLIRLSDFPVWLGIGLATVLVLAAYGALYNTLGLIAPKYGVYFCIILGIWEFIMGMFTMTLPSASVPMLSISHWALQLIDAIVLIAWPDTLQYTQITSAFGIDSGLSFFWQPPVHTLGTQSPVVALLVSITVLLLITVAMVGIGQASFKNREIM
jgi:ABC-type transport system involved in multi-copper enzyme maturation permease subunit